MKRSKLFSFVLFLWAVIFWINLSSASETTFSIDTSDDWMSFDSEQADWNTLGFDDSSWRNAYEDYSTHPDTSSYPELSEAYTIWDWPYIGTPSGSNGPNEAYFRYSFYLDDSVDSALFSYAVDDNMILYINGNIAYTDNGYGANTETNLTIDTSLFVIGENLIAIYAWDGAYNTVYNRGGEALTANLLIETNPVPEPATMLLLGSGIIGLAGFRRKFKKS